MKEPCTFATPGWRCTRARGHFGPCAAVPIEADPLKLFSAMEVATAVRDLPLEYFVAALNFGLSAEQGFERAREQFALDVVVQLLKNTP